MAVRATHVFEDTGDILKITERNYAAIWKSIILAADAVVSHDGKVNEVGCCFLLSIVKIGELPSTSRRQVFDVGSGEVERIDVRGLVRVLPGVDNCVQSTRYLYPVIVGSEATLLVLVAEFYVVR